MSVYHHMIWYLIQQPFATSGIQGPLTLCEQITNMQFGPGYAFIEYTKPSSEPLLIETLETKSFYLKTTIVFLS